MILYVSGAYTALKRETIAEEVRKEGFDPIPITDVPGQVYPEHEHPETKLLVFLKGSMRVTVASQSFHCQAGDKLLIPGNTRHSAVVGEEGCTFFWSEKLMR